MIIYNSPSPSLSSKPVHHDHHDHYMSQSAFASGKDIEMGITFKVQQVVMLLMSHVKHHDCNNKKTTKLKQTLDIQLS